MKRSIGTFLLGMATSVAALLIFGVHAGGQTKLDANAQLCYDFETKVIFGGQLALIPQFITDDYLEHNVNNVASGIQEYTKKAEARTAAQAARGGVGRGVAPPAIVFSHDDVVVFVRPRAPQDDPKNPGQKLPPTTHFDVWRMRNGKIAEHWD